ncbi:MAG: glycosyltransferase family 2 protein [Anaerolineae bacterium]|nr:glycosyltransferase family 2 protein [Anaerolineae bacterium]
MSKPLFSIVIPHWNGKDFLKPCLDALGKQSYQTIEIIVVDNASEDGSQQVIKDHYPDVCLIELPENRGFTGACNAGMEAANGDIIALLNNDTEVHPEWVQAVVDVFENHADVGIVASKMLLFLSATISIPQATASQLMGDLSIVVSGKRMTDNSIMKSTFLVPVEALLLTDGQS